MHNELALTGTSALNVSKGSWKLSATPPPSTGTRQFFQLVEVLGETSGIKEPKLNQLGAAVSVQAASAAPTASQFAHMF